MNISSFIQTLVASIVGGAIVIATNWITAQTESRKANQEWYERIYITEGIDPLVTYFMALGLYYAGRRTGGRIDETSVGLGVIPVDAVARVQIYLNSTLPTEIIGMIQAYRVGTKPGKINFGSKAIVDTSKILLEERTKIISAKIHTKIM